jgi:hypothetical protein
MLELMNSPVVITVLAIAGVWVLTWWGKKKPEHKRIIDALPGILVTACKWSEKTFAGKPGHEKLAAASQKGVELFAEIKGRMPTAEEVAEIKAALPVVHNELERDGTL